MAKPNSQYDVFISYRRKTGVICSKRIIAGTQSCLSQNPAEGKGAPDHSSNQH